MKALNYLVQQFGIRISQHSSAGSNAALAALAALAGPISATNTNAAQPATGVASSSDSMPQGQAFTGTIVKGSDGYMLQDVPTRRRTAGQRKAAKKFSGKT